MEPVKGVVSRWEVDGAAWFVDTGTMDELSPPMDYVCTMGLSELGGPEVIVLSHAGTLANEAARSGLFVAAVLCGKAVQMSLEMMGGKTPDVVRLTPDPGVPGVERVVQLVDGSDLLEHLPHLREDCGEDVRLKVAKLVEVRAPGQPVARASGLILPETFRD